MIGDLILILFLGVIWWKLIRLKKTDFGRFLLEFGIYFFIFVFTILFYKFFFNINRIIFPEVLYPSIVGIFTASFIFTYISFKLAIFLLNKKKPAWRIENKIYNFVIRILDFINPSTQDFEKVFIFFAFINLVIIGTLFNSLVDVFSFKNRLYVDKGEQSVLILKEQRIISEISGNDNFKYNIAKAIEFTRLTNPHYYEQIINNTEKIILSDTLENLARAGGSDFSITFNAKYGKRRYETIKEYLGLATILVHESQHLKDYKRVKDRGGFIGFIGGEIYFKIACNPITNYENFVHIFRATYVSFDEWCAQIEEVKFMRMYNVDYKNDNELRELFR